MLKPGPVMGFEPVMYLSDDSLALLDASPEVAGLNLLDMCCGSGVQGISAMAKKAASVTFSDVNPRALQFVRVNLAITASFLTLVTSISGMHFHPWEMETNMVMAGTNLMRFLPIHRSCQTRMALLHKQSLCMGTEVLLVKMYSVLSWKDVATGLWMEVGFWWSHTHRMWGKCRSDFKSRLDQIQWWVTCQ